METVSFIGFAEPLSSWTHLLAALAALVGSFFLVRKGKGSTARVIALGLYSFSLVFLFSMSGVYHLLEIGGDARAVLQRLDHAGIWILIAGTFTPVHIILFRGAWRWLILLIVWVIAITGLVLEVIFFTSFPEALILSLFLGLGWMGVLTGYRFRTAFQGESLRLLILGGIFYSFGAVFDFIKWPVIWPAVLGPHEVFHVFVIFGSLSHWCFVYEWASHPVANKITFQIQVFLGHRFVGTAINDHVRVEASTLEELKSAIRHKVRAKYHASFQPEIHLKYSNEEIL